VWRSETERLRARELVGNRRINSRKRDKEHMCPFRDPSNPAHRFWAISDESDRFWGHFAHTTRSVLGSGLLLSLGFMSRVSLLIRFRPTRRSDSPPPLLPRRESTQNDARIPKSTWQSAQVAYLSSVFKYECELKLFFLYELSVRDLPVWTVCLVSTKSRENLEYDKVRGW